MQTESATLTDPGPARPALQGIRVLEIGTGPALAYAGKLFSDFGAEVFKAEKPEGDPWRRMPPLIEAPGAPADSALFAWLNTNKRSVIAAGPQDARRLAQLALSCDVVLDARALEEGIGVLRRPAWGGDEASAGPAVAIDFTWFGASGPYAHFNGGEAVCRSLAGAVHGSGPVDGPPHLPHDLQTGIVAGLTAFTTALAALMGRGQGARRFTLSLHEAAFGVVEMEAGMVQDGRHPLARLGVNRFCGTHPAGIYETADGWVGLFTHTLAQWAALCDAIGRPELANDPRYASGPERMARADEVDALLVPALRERTARDWFERLGARKHPTVLVPTMAELLRQDVHRGRGAFVKVRAKGRCFEAPVVPLPLGAAGPLPGGPAPSLGQHDGPFRGGPPPHSRACDTPAAAAQFPLEGLRVLDLTMGWAGPLASRSLADLGAEVIKVESTGYPDWWRGANFTEQFYEERLYEKNNNFNLMNRNKRGITLDLTSAEGRELLLTLASRCDAVIENYSAEVLPKLGLDYPVLHAANPRLVMLSMPAFGLGNAWSDTRAYGGTLEQASGLPLYTGHAAFPPAMTSYAYGDPIGGLNAGAALLLALYFQRRTGQGSHVNLSQVEAMLAMTAPFMIEQSLHGSVPTRQGNRHPMFAPHGCYRCAGADAWLTLSVTGDLEWEALCRVLARPDFAADARLRTAEGRRAHAGELDAVIAAWLRGRDAEDAMSALQAAGIAAGVVRPMADVLRDRHLHARAFWQPVERAFVGSYLSSTTPYRQAGAPMPLRCAAPTLGQHTAAVLNELAGLDTDTIAALDQRGVTGTTARRKPARS